MPAIADLVLNDGTEPTAVAKTFKVLNRGPVVAWEDRTSAYPVEWARVTNSHSRNKNGLTRIRYKFELPVTEVPSGGGNPVKVGSITIDCTALIPEKAPIQLRKHALAYLRSAAGQSGFGDVIRNAEPYY